MRTPVSVIVVWVVFAVAWFAPSMDGRGEGDLAGWTLFLAALQSGRLVPVLSALSNWLMVVSVLHFARRPGAKPRAWLIGGFVVATILNSTWIWAYRGPSFEDLRVGYWLWLASFAAMAMALVAVRSRVTVEPPIEDVSPTNTATHPG